MTKTNKIVLCIVLASVLMLAVFSAVLPTTQTAKAEDKAYITLTFPGETTAKTSVYTTTWKAICSEKEWSIANFNNNNLNWAYIRCGRNGTTSVAYIATAFAIDKKIEKIAVTIDSVTVANVNSFKLYSCADGSKWEVVKQGDDEGLTIANGINTFEISSPQENMYYKIEFDCAKGTKNGFVQISKVEYYAVQEACAHTSKEHLEVKAATCTEDGIKVDCYHCTTENGCNGYFSDEACTSQLTEADVIEKAAGHVWNEGEVTTAATCSTKGVKTFTCKNCTATKTEEIAMADHTWSDWTVTKEASCVDGEKTRTCSVCSKTETEKIAATGAHNYVDGKCSVCGQEQPIVRRFDKVTTAPTDWSGEYIIVYEGDNNAAYVFTGVDEAKNYTAGTIAAIDGNNTITETTTNEFVTATIAKMDDGTYSIFINGTYIGGGSSNGITFNKATALSNQISFNSDGELLITNGTTTLRFNSNSGSLWFRYFKSSQKAISLYKRYVDGTCTHTKKKVEADIAATCMAAGKQGSWTCYDCGYVSEGTEITKLDHSYGEDGKCVNGCGCTKAENDLLDGIFALASGKYLLDTDGTTKKTVTITGKIVSIDTAYSEKYNNITVTIQIGNWKTRQICCYKMKYGATREVGQELTVTGVITNYNGTYEFASGSTPSHPLDKAVKTEKVAKTCSTQGNIEYWTCPDCGQIFKDAGLTIAISQSDTIISASHTFPLVEHKKVDSTCSAEGTEAYWECSACNALFSDEEAINPITNPVSIAKKGHFYGDPVVVVEPTCTEIGTTTTTCNVCGATLETHPAALGHDTTHTAEKEATCIEDGNFEYWTCSRCKKIYSDSAYEDEITLADTVVTKLNHKGKTHTEAVDAKCGVAGKIEYWYCKLCDKYFTDEACTTSVEKEALTQKALEHIWDEGTVDTAATCTEIGLKVYACTRTGCNGQKVEEIPVLDHKYVVADAVWNLEGEISCTKTKTCSHDSTHVVTEVATIANGKIEKKVTQALSCKNNEVSTLKVTFADAELGSETKENVTTATATGAHVYETLVKIDKAATCTEKGQATYKCNGCDETTTKEIAATDHNFGEWTVTTPATCLEKGIETRTCQNNGCTQKETREIAAIGHKELSHTEKLDATCIADGNIEYWTCAVCKKMYSDSECNTEVTSVVIEKLSHKNKVHHDAVAPKCTQNGSIEYWSCPDCGLKFSNEACTTAVTDQGIVVNQLGHDVDTNGVTTKQPTCTEAGEISYSCKREGCTYVEVGKLSALGHDFGDWTETTPATCTAEGVKTRTCKHEGCTEKETQSTQALGHSYDHDHACKDKTCLVCGNVVKATEDHQWQLTREVAPTAKEVGHKYYNCSVCGEAKEEQIPATGKTGCKSTVTTTAVTTLLVGMGLVVGVIKKRSKKQ